MNRFCGNCGQKLDSKSVFCSNCGTHIENTNDNKNVSSEVMVEQISLKEENKTLKTVSLVIGIVSIVLSLFLNFFIIPLAIIGLIIGIVYTSKSKKFCAGIILNIIGILLTIIIITLLVATFNNIYSSFDEMWNENYDTSVENNYNDNYFNDDDYYDDVDDYYDDVDDYFKKVSVNEAISLVTNKKDFILIISQTTCSHCTNYKPKMMKIANKYKLNVYYIEYNLLSVEEKNTFYSNVPFEGTPTTVFFQNGVENEEMRIVGDKLEEDIEMILRNNGYIE